MSNFTLKGILFTTCLLISLVALATEPGGYPSGFSASTTDATHIKLQWTESSTGQAATGYLIVGRIGSASYPSVTDANPVPDDTNWGDDVAAINIPAGSSYDFTVLADKDYEFKIYPYTGTGATIDFRTSATVPVTTGGTLFPTLTPGGTPVTSITTTGATINYTINTAGSKPITGGGVIWSTANTLDFATPASYTLVADAAVNSTGGWATLVSSLPPGTQIYYRAYATNSLGTKQTAVASFNTADPIPANHVTTFAAAATDATTIHLSWVASIGSPAPTGYLIIARLTSAAAITAPTNGTAIPTDESDFSDDYATLNVTSGTATSADFTVDADESYEFKIYPYFNTSGPNKPYYKTDGTVPTKTASTTAPALTLDATPATSIATNGATINYTISDLGAGSVTDRGVIWGTNTAIDFATPATYTAKVSSGTASTIGGYNTPFTGAAAGTQIFYRAYATNAAGTTQTAKGSFFTYANAPANAIANTITATALTGTSIKVDFPTMTSTGGANLKGYSIFRRQGATPAGSSVVNGKSPSSLTDAGSNFNFVVIITDPTKGTYTDTGLSPDTQYYYTVVPFNSNSSDDAGTYNYNTTGGLKVANATTLSASSDIVYNTGGTPTDKFIYSRTNTPPLEGTHPISISDADNLGRFIIRDGGSGTNDSDNKKTIITSIKVQITNFENIHSIGLFDDVNDVLYAGTDYYDLTTGDIIFTPTAPIVVNDNTQLEINLRVWTRPIVDDHEVMIVTIKDVKTLEDGTSSGMAAADGGGAHTLTDGTENKIDVQVGQFTLTANPVPSSSGTPFDLIATAIADEGYPSIDVDYIGQVKLTGTGGNLSGSTVSGNHNMVAGSYTWTTVSFTTGGNYTLKCVRVSSSDIINDGVLPLSIGSQAVTINTISKAICYGSNFKALDPIIIQENDNKGFGNGSSTSPNKTFSLQLPSGFKFNTAKTTGLSVKEKGTSPAQTGDLSNPSNYTYTGDDIVQFSFDVNSSTHLDEISIGGLEITATFPSNLAQTSYTGEILRLAGTATISGDAVGEDKSHGTLTAAQKTPAPSDLGFTVAKVNSSDADIAPSETRFSKTLTGVKLSGTPFDNFAVFSCPTPGAISRIGSTEPYEYRFIPSALAAGDYTVTYTVSSGTDGCDFIFSKVFTVYESNIDGLATSYCSNSPASGELSVSQSVIDGVYSPTLWGAPFQFVKLVYAVPNLFGGPDTILDMPLTGGKYIFDPTSSIYLWSYWLTGGVNIGWVAKNAAGTFTGNPIFSFVTIKTAPTPSIDVSAFPPGFKFCSDDAAVTLVGTPANSDDISADFFTASSAQSSTVSNNGGTPRVWSFSPSSATVSVGSPVSIDLTYTYRDPTTGCTGISPKVTVRVAGRPGSVTPLTPAAGSKAVCQNGIAPTFTVPTVTGTTYNWYSDQALTTHAGAAGDSFTPLTSTAIDGETFYYITQTIDECESNRQSTASITATTVKLTVNPTPGPPVSDFTKAYCQNAAINDADFFISAGSSVQWYKSGTASSIFSGTTPTVSDIQDPLKLNVSTGSVMSYNFNVTQTVANCEGAPTKVVINVLPLPQLDLSSSRSLTQICVTGGPINLSATDGGLPADGATGTGTWSGIGGLTTALGSANATLDPSNIPPGDYQLTFNFKYGTAPPNPQCSNSITKTVIILPSIKPLVNPGDACEKAFVALNNESEIDFGDFGKPGHSAPPPATITRTQWNFGDGSGLPEGPKDDAVVDGKTKGTYFDPQHLFNNTGGVLMTYIMTTSDNCVVQATKALTISPKPNASFVWKTTWINTTSTTEFQASTSPVLAISNYDWNFSKYNLLDYVPHGTDAHPTANYTSLGKDTVQLIVATQFNCKDTVKQVVYVVPGIDAINIDNAYTQSFNDDAGNWLDGGKNSSWAVGKPSGENIKTDGAGNQAWDTNPAGISNPGEQSWVLSPSFNFTEAVKPIISFDIWSDTPLQNDGAVLQYNEDGNILNDASWKVLGVPGQGANWYDVSGISSRPGNQASNDVGWSGIYGGWKHTAYKLDDLKGKKGIVFRIAFASSNPRRDGFAFDNVFIGERTRTVLLENFTNSSPAANTKAHNDIFRAFSEDNDAEVTKVEYHTAFPGSDPINAMNTAINSSRAAFYGLSSPGMFSVDGQIATNVADMNQIYNDRVLTPASLKVEITPVKVDEDVVIAVKITNQTNLTIPLAKANVFTVLIEKSITDPSLLGGNGDTKFTFVARKMLPNAAGVPVGQDIAPNSSLTLPGVVWDELSLLDANNGAIAVFIQNTEGDDKNVFQSAIVDATVVPDVTTGTVLPEAAEGVRLYPNPVNGAEVTITLPEKARQDLPVSLIDAQGRYTRGTSIPKGTAQHNVTTSDLTNGFYIVEIEMGAGRFVRKKLMVMH